MELALVHSFFANDTEIIIMQWPLKKKADFLKSYHRCLSIFNWFEYSQAKYSLSYHVKYKIITDVLRQWKKECVGLTSVSVVYFCMVGCFLQLFIINLHHAWELHSFFSYIMECVGVCIIQMG